jgi:CBS domain containing-hemolysin-like protein
MSNNDTAERAGEQAGLGVPINLGDPKNLGDPIKRDALKEGSRSESKSESRPESWLDRFKSAIGIRPAASIRDDLEVALDGQLSGLNDEFSGEERRILRNLLAARDLRVADVMVPRGSIIGISEQASFAELRAVFTSAGHSRLPVYGETLDDPKGMVHIKDVFSRLEDTAPAKTVEATGFVRPLLFAPGSKPALDLLLEMQAKRIHIALVIDEYGSTDGLVSLEDLIEIIVGEIEDEHDEAENLNLVRGADGAITIDATANIDDVARELDLELDPASEDHDIGTIGGYVTALAGHVPEVNTTIEGPSGLRFVILDGDNRRIKRLRIERSVA